MVGLKRGVGMAVFGVLWAGAAGAAVPAGSQPAPDLAAAKADLQARAAWTHAELARIAAVVEKRPVTSRPALRARDGRLSPDPRPTAPKAVEAARGLDARVDTVVEQALKALAPHAANPDMYPRQQMLARLQVNEAVELVLGALKDADVPMSPPTWLGAPATALPPVTWAKLEAEIASAVLEVWREGNPRGVTGVGVAGAGGKESVFSLTQGQTVRGLADVASPRVSFRISGGKTVTSTTPNFTLVLLRPLDLGKAELGEGAILEKRLSSWWTRPKVPDVSAAAGSTPRPKP